VKSPSYHELLCTAGALTAKRGSGVRLKLMGTLTPPCLAEIVLTCDVKVKINGGGKAV